jgi:hypothetical protein
MKTTDFYILAAPLQSDQELTEEARRLAIKQPSFTRRKVEAEPETRLWKICAQAAPPRLGAAEWIALLLFGASAICVLACCVFEWLQLSNSGSLDRVVRELLTR